ncbi:MAG TPA: 30S ribosomal protein S9, partial [bacterium]|nr:30S ribosomal protein S9 [bacterium]
MASKTDTIFGLGRRKRAIAQVFMRQGSGNITVNDKKLEEYFDKEILILKVKQPLVLTNNEKTFDIKITAK